jgi:2,3-bisphosphoglycerate-independent phosphoglycerate mutase
MRRRVVDNMWSGFQEAFRLLKGSNVFMHVEETDDISHRLAPDQKVSLLKEVDDLLMENIDRMVGSRVAFVVDHGTSSLSGQHLRMKVPYAAGEVGRASSRSVRFCEKAERHRPLGDLLDSILDH